MQYQVLKRLEIPVCDIKSVNVTGEGHTLPFPTGCLEQKFFFFFNSGIKNFKKPSKRNNLKFQMEFIW